MQRKAITIISYSLILLVLSGCARTEAETIEEPTSKVESTVEPTVTPSPTPTPTSTSTPVEEEYTITFENSSNEEITAKDGETVVISKYERQKIKNIIAPVFDNFDSSDTENYNILETTENEDGSTTYLVSLESVELTENAVTQYSSDDKGNVKALFVYQSALDTTPDQLALKFEITQKEDKSVTLDKIYDIFDNDVSDITLYNGDCIGWSLTKFANEIDFEFLDEIHISQDLTLYPVMDTTNAAEQGEDLSVGKWMKTFNGKNVKLGDKFDGKNIGFTIKEGKVIPTDETKEVDQKTGELKEATKQETNKKETQTNKGNTDNNGKTNNGEQSSTSGGTGNSQTSGAPGGDANVPDEPSGGMSLEDAAAKFGMTYGGSGGSVGNIGDGGHGIIFE